MNILLSMALLLVSTIGFACDCAYSINDSIPAELYKDVDFIGYAHVVNDYPMVVSNADVVNDPKQFGHFVLKIDSVIKGDVFKGQLIFTNQTGSGNCMKILEIGDEILVLGKKINQFESINQSFDWKNPSSIIYDLDQNGTFSSSVFNSDDIDYWNGLIKESVVIHTNQCQIVRE